VLNRLRWLALGVLLAGCASNDPATSASPSSEASGSASPSTSSAPPSTAAPPSVAEPTGELLEGYGLFDLLQAEVDALAVRVAPDTQAPLATGYRLFDGTSIGDVRLNTGDYVTVDLGPLQLGETTWYRVWPAEGGRPGYSTILWDTQNNGANPVEPGWVAASVGSDEYLSLYHEAPEFDPVAAGLPAPLLISGIGDYLSGPQDGFDLFALYWAHAIDEQVAPCDLTVTMVAVNGGASFAPVDVSLTGAFDEGQEHINFASHGPIGPYQVSVSSGCEWSLHLEALGHD
jgi:hypothetical protein